MKLIDDKGFKYRLYEEENGHLILHIPIPEPAPGYTVIHTLTSKEKADYQKKGGEAFDARIQDMKSNFRNYKHSSWR